MAIARNPMFVLDCPDAAGLARFYSALLDWPVRREESDWAEIASGDTVIAFQRVQEYRAPEWPGQEHPQQAHIDVDVDDLDAAETATLVLGAKKHDVQPGEGFRVFLDPAGHTFCLCRAA